ncbi:MAG: hypothetical protein DMF40_13635 [Verrucomicrobia bacterium]|nr:MAG: hypothetical protein DMF40_13635 [Verrucomicrobiota bacterium]
MSIKGKNFVGKFTKHRTAHFSRVPLFLSSGGVDALVVSRNFERRHRGAPSTVAAVVGRGPLFLANSKNQNYSHKNDTCFSAIALLREPVLRSILVCKGTGTRKFTRNEKTRSDHQAFQT